MNRYVNYGVPTALNFKYNDFSEKTISFVNSLKTTEPFSFRYAPSVGKPTIYGSVYACMLYGLFNKLEKFSVTEKIKWAEYFNSFQNTEGLFIDPCLENDNYYNIEWWGANHLSLHLIICYTYLGINPKHEFNYIKKYYNPSGLKAYLNNLNFDDIKTTDADNAIMNLGSLLQYQRDFFKDEHARKVLDILFNELEKRINPKWGSWCYGSDDDMVYLSRAQQFAYHLYPLWLYDKKPIPYMEKLIDLTLKTQTILGGFGAQLNSSACEDIDAIYLLVKFTSLTDYRKEEINIALNKAFRWVLTNQNNDDGFVFKRNEPFVYGHTLTSSKKNESALFPTWFRTLSIAYLTNYLLDTNFKLIKCPGLIN